MRESTNRYSIPFSKPYVTNSTEPQSLSLAIVRKVGPFANTVSSMPIGAAGIASFRAMPKATGFSITCRGVISTDAEQSAGSFRRLARPQHPDHKPFHQDRKSTVRLGPRRRRVDFAALRAIHQRNACIDKLLGLTGVEVPTRPFIGVVVADQLLLALWALPSVAYAVRDVNMKGCRFHVQSPIHDVPGTRQPEQLLEAVAKKPLQILTCALQRLATTRLIERNLSISRHASELTDEQWSKIEPLIPKRKPSKKGGRKRFGDCRCLEGILWVLRTGARWKDLPVQYPSPATCLRRLQEWEDAGIWLDLWRKFLGELDKERILSWDETFSDGTLSPEKKGAPTSAKPNAERVQSSWWWQTAGGYLCEFALPQRLRRKSRSLSRRSSK